jgi:hypothetical protein
MGNVYANLFSKSYLIPLPLNAEEEQASSSVLYENKLMKEA